MNSKLKLLLLAISGIFLGFLLMFFGQPKPKVAMLNFNHSKHQKISCEVCHQGVRKQLNATVPSTTTCEKCHATSPDKTQAGMAIWQESEKNGPWLWPVSYRLPAHVYFSHRRHVQLGNLDCKTCHGDMTAQTVPVVKALKTLNMNSCRDCHDRMQVINECSQCHR